MAEPPEPSPLVVDVDDDRRHVVGRAAVERLLDERLAGVAGRVRVGEHRADPLLRHVAGEAVGAEHPPVAGDRAEDPGVDLGRLVDVAEHPHQHAAPRMHGGLLDADAAGLDEPLHEGVVVRDLAELAVAEQVDARVADVRGRDRVADPYEGADRRAHAGELRVLVDGLADQLVGGDERRLQGELRLLRVREVEAVGLRDPVHGDRRGDVAARVAAHAVGDDEQLGPRVAGVLVVRPHATHVRDRCACGDDGHALTHGARTWSRPPSPARRGGTCVGESMRWPSTNVPFVESRSCTTQSEPQSRRRA